MKDGGARWHTPSVRKHKGRYIAVPALLLLSVSRPCFRYFVGKLRVP